MENILSILSMVLNILIVIGGVILAPQIARIKKIEEDVDEVRDMIKSLPCVAHAERISRMEGKMNGSSGKG